jgi:hypothetical protein
VTRKPSQGKGLQNINQYPISGIKENMENWEDEKGKRERK